MKRLIQLLCQIKFSMFFFLGFSICISCESKEQELETQETPILQLHDRPLIKGEVKNGKKEGDWVSYFPNGKVQSQCFFIEGIPHGITKVFSENGQLLYSGEYNMGKQVGRWKFIDPISGEISYKEH